MFLSQSYGPISMTQKDLGILYFRGDGAIVLFYPWSKLFVIRSLLFFLLEKSFFEEIARTDHVSTLRIF